MSWTVARALADTPAGYSERGLWGVTTRRVVAGGARPADKRASAASTTNITSATAAPTAMYTGHGPMKSSREPPTGFRRRNM